MQTKIALIVDSASDVPGEILAQYQNIEVAPMLVTMADGNTYLDRETIQPDEFYQQLAVNDTLPKTASPTVGSVKAQVERLQEQGFTQIIGITISSGLSVSYSVFKQVAADAEAEMTVVDTKNIGIGSGLFAVYAEQLIDNGLAYHDIVARLQDAVADSKVYFYIPTLKYLRAGGRIGRVAGLLGTMLSIKPVISCDENGIYYPMTKARTEAKAVSKLIAAAVATAEGQPDFRIAVTQGANPALLAKVVAKLQARFPNQLIYTGNVSPALGVHTGPGLVGVAVQVGVTH
jgi:DegV family protein with EDD domain